MHHYHSLTLTESLPGDFSVWLVSDEARFLRGRTVWTNWDVKELIARKSEILDNKELLTVALSGLSFQNWSVDQIHEYVAASGTA
jgi:hypothetical protein